MINLFKYLDYRILLQDLLEEKKSENSMYSHRMILSKIGVASSSLFCNVIKGRSNLTIMHVTKLAQLFGLSNEEEHYFKLLLYFSKAKSSSEKNDFFNQMIKYRKLKGRSITTEERTLFSKWYYPVIYAITEYHSITDNYGQIGSYIRPALRDYEVKECLKTLTQLGLLSQDKNGQYHHSEAILTTGDEIQSMYVTQYQMHMIDLAKHAIEKINPEERDISGVTFSISREKYSLLKSEFQAFRKKIMQIASDDGLSSEMVVRCNLQLFPLTKEEL